MSEWQPIETAPKDGADILVHMRGNTHMVVSYDDCANPDFPWCTLDGPNYAAGAPTHWMPLPEPPKT